MEYMSCPEAAKKWGISERRVQKLCEENRIQGVSKIGYMWLIPKNAENPQMGEEKIRKVLYCNISRTFACYTTSKAQRRIGYETDFDCRR